MTEVIGVVEHGRIKLPESIRLPEGQAVRVLLEGAWNNEKPLPPLEEEEWTEEDLRIDLEWAMRQRPPA